MNPRRGKQKRRLFLERLEQRSVPTTLVALVDSGVDETSSGASDAPYYDLADGYDATNGQSVAQYGTAVVSDDSGITHGHGSTVADYIVQGIIAATSQLGSSAPTVKILPIRVWDPTGPNSKDVDTNALIRGIYYAADNGAAVINVSDRYFKYDPSLSDSSSPHNGATLGAAIAYAQTKGAIVVNSVGNESTNVDAPGMVQVFPAFDTQYTYAVGNLTNLLVDAAVDPSNHLTQYSSWGPVHVNVGAYTGSGGNAVTSYSTGYTTGVAGVVAALTPGQSPGQRIGIIEGTVTPAPQSVGAWSTTGGVINPTAAARQALASSTSFVAAGASGNVANSSFVADSSDVSGSTGTYPISNTIDTSGVANPAPQAVYQNERFALNGGNFTETISNLSPNTQYDVKLDFSENFDNSAGARQFNVKINGNQVLTNFDIFATAGAKFKAVVKSFEDVAADGGGKITIEFDSITNKDTAKVDGIEITPAPVRPILIAAGSSNPIAPFVADNYVTGGQSYSVSSGQYIDTAGIDDPPPLSVLQSERFDNSGTTGPNSGFTYTIPNLAPGAAYTTRLVFSENYYQSAGQRQFNVTINNVQVLTDFDIYQLTYTRFKAIAESFYSTADSNGSITIKFTSVTGQAKVDAVEITPVANDPARVTQVDLSGSFNAVGITSDGASSAGNLDGGGHSYSANQLGASLNIGTASYNFGVPGINDAVKSTGQTINLPNGNFTSLHLLGTAYGGEKSDPFVINYTDGGSTVYLNWDDWYSNHNDTGGPVAGMPYLNNSNGSKDTDVGTFFMYQNTIALDPARTVRSLTLPNDSNVAIFAADLLP